MKGETVPVVAGVQAVVSAEDKEIDDLLEVISDLYGYDFRQYSRAHIKRRVLQRLRLSHFNDVRQLRHRVLQDPDFTALILRDFSINVTEMFRDPDFYLAVREQVVPLLKTWSFIKVWHAGCSTGEEVYSMAILLKEENLYDRVQIYATDINPRVLTQASDGIFCTEAMKRYAQNYQCSGAKSSFSDYYHAKYDSAIMDPALKKNIVWATHNLVTDSDFAEIHLLICRNVMIYFNPQLQNSVHRLFHRSLVNGGILCLGKKESLNLTTYNACYTEIDRKRKIYKKNYGYEQDDQSRQLGKT